jgi:hypothetical protein
MQKIDVRPTLGLWVIYYQKHARTILSPTAFLKGKF